jgi:membrane protein
MGLINKALTTTTTSGVTVSALLIIALAALFYIFYILRFRPGDWLTGLAKLILKITGKNINKAERDYERNLEIGRYKQKSVRVKVYKFLNDLTIDLDLKASGYTPYTLLFFIVTVSVVIAFIVSNIVFRNLWLFIFALPIVFAAISCFLYTRANIAHDSRIDDVIASENIISNNVSKGVVVSIRMNLDSFPIKLQPVFREFVDSVETRNTHVRTALIELGSNLGSVSDDFIQKCITFELEEEHGLVGIFNDVVEVNSIKSEFRIYMKRKFEEVMFEFIMGLGMIFFFLGGIIALYPMLQKFYFVNIFGQILLLLDGLLIVAEFVYITYLRAQEL